MANNEICDCKTVIKELSSLDLLNCSDKDVQAILQKLYAKPIAAPLCDYPADTVIVRGRPITSAEQIKYKHELSYVPADKNKKYQRGSTPNQTMFYGILSDTNDTQLVGCLGEICDCLREPNPQDGEYYAIISFWIARETISLFTIINPESPSNKSDNLKRMAEELNLFTEEYKDYFDKEDVISLQKFMYHQYNKKALTENDYWIPALFTMDLIKSENIDGILYESAQVADEQLDNVLCLAIKPESADKKLSFLSAVKVTITIKDGKATVKGEPIDIQ